MAKSRRRCSECRKTFTPSSRAAETQLVCGGTCRARRDRKLARRRRRKELEDYRKDECARQRAHREALRNGAERPDCHAPPSPGKLPEFQKKVVDFVDRALARSRASLLRDLAGFVPRAREFLADTG